MWNHSATRPRSKWIVPHLILVGWLAASVSAQADLLALYTFTGETAAATPSSPSITASAFGVSSGSLSFDYAQEGTWTGSGVPYAQGSGGWAAEDPASAKFFHYTLDAAPGTSFSITNISFLARSTGAGPSAIGISINGATVFDVDAPANATFPVSVPISGYDDLATAEIRILGWDNGSRETTGGGHFRIDDVLTEGVADGEPLPSIPVRVASFNVEHGLGEPGLEPPGTDQYNSVKAIIERIDPDIIGFQEMMVSHFDHWYMLADELNYPYVVIGDRGDFDTMRQGYFSRYPIVSTHNVTSPPGAKELVRAPFRAVVEIPGAKQPLVLWNMHQKAMGDNASVFRRAVEAIRIVQDIDAYRTENPDHDAFIFMGDLNDDVTDTQPIQFNAPPSGLPVSYQLGDDISFPVPYRLFPTDRYRDAGGGMVQMDVFRTGSDEDARCTRTCRLSYMFVSDALFYGPMGSPAGEVYFSGGDDGSSGQPKYGDPLPAETSWNASDHLLIFTDIHMPAVLPDDGIPAAWRIQYFGHPEPRADGGCRAEDDPDGNGMTNWEEYIAGTHPLDPESTLQLNLQVLPDGDSGLQFDSVTGRLYSIEYRADLGAESEWTPVDDFIDVPGTGDAIIYEPDFSAASPRFYRLRVRLAP